MYEWGSSIFLHRCKNCGRWIKPRADYVVKYGGDIIEERYCSPICARERRKKEEQAQEQIDELNRMIYGDEDEQN